jgi:hypothetical protein
MNLTLYGYLEFAYLISPYATGFGIGEINTQVSQHIRVNNDIQTQIAQRIETDTDVRTQLERRIADNVFAINTQIQRRIEADADIRTQVSQRIETDTDIRTQFERRVEASAIIRSQFDRLIANNTHTVYSQFDRAIFSAALLPSQFDRRIDSGLATIRTQYQRQVVSDQDTFTQIKQRVVSNPGINTQFKRHIFNGSKTTRTEFGRGPVSHEFCKGYLTDAYLSEPYLAPFICAHLRTQLERITAYRLHTQITQVIYNTTNLRILCDFPSRGTSGTNWSVISGGTEAGDFGINNVNTDIVEQRYQATAKVVTIQCDTEISQGIFNDTLAILGHNFTTSASVTMQGSNDPTFVIVGMSEVLTVERENLYWISPTLPLTSYRYWRFQIVDTTNSENIKIGTIVFGSSIIFNGECFIDDVVRRKTHFADRIRTEGYTAISNDRALKRAVSLSFRRLDFNKDNYDNLVGVIDTARTSLKCLWIPTPEYASRFAVFGKLAEIPVENHKVIGQNADYIDLDITVDEAL